MIGIRDSVIQLRDAVQAWEEANGGELNQLQVRELRRALDDLAARV